MKELGPQLLYRGSPAFEGCGQLCGVLQEEQNSTPLPWVKLDKMPIRGFHEPAWL